MIKVGFTGTQDGMTRHQRAGVKLEVRNIEISEAHHGDCVGSDEEFHEIVREVSPQTSIVIHPPVAYHKRAFKRGDVLLAAKKYIPRNHDIVDAVGLMIATPKSEKEQIRSGTWATIRYALQQGINVVCFWPDGTRTVLRP